MKETPIPESIDIPFSVPYTHRLRMTDDVCGSDYGQLECLLDPGETDQAKVLFVSETALERAANRLTKRLKASEAVQLVGPPMMVTGGEAIKNSDREINAILSAIHEANLDRRSYIIAMGGGAMLDAVGYAAAIAHRGIRLVRLPTTTLAQADSGVGVKNAINRFEKKNWVGTFAVPWAVINDMRLLETLPDRDFRSGFSEAVKVALLKDREHFDWLCKHADALRDRDPAVTKQAIYQSCLFHLQHITTGGDPFEMLEARPLDFGHWSAHRLEPLTGYRIRHGEAVGIGVAIDCIYSSMKYGFPDAAVESVCDCLHRLGLPLWDAELEPIDRLMQGLEEFRQHLGGRLTVTMLRSIGQPINVHEIDDTVMRNAIDRLREIASRMQPSRQ